LQDFFLQTLAISDQMVRTALNGWPFAERRKQPSCRQSPERVKEEIKCHISQFQTVPSHYCRRSSEKQYLPQDLTLAQMYRMYSDECIEKGKTPASRKIYNSVFHRYFNLSFHKPKKDLRDLCEKFSHSSVQEQAETKNKFEEHMTNKVFCRQLKDEKKQKADSDHNVRVACYDLQQVLVTPRTSSSQLYYRRKLATYNLTVFDIGKKKGYCYMWHESVTQRGANNIASCVWRYIEDQAQCGDCKEFVFF